jgi:hypothetical protein
MIFIDEYSSIWQYFATPVFFSHFFPENVDFWGKKHKKTANPL